MVTTKFLTSVGTVESYTYLCCNLCEKKMAGAFRAVWWTDAAGKPRDAHFMHYKCADKFVEGNPAFDWQSRGNPAVHITWP